jgi:hypothetical protein
MRVSGMDECRWKCGVRLARTLPSREGEFACHLGRADPTGFDDAEPSSGPTEQGTHRRRAWRLRRSSQPKLCIQRRTTRRFTRSQHHALQHRRRSPRLNSSYCRFLVNQLLRAKKFQQ